MASRKLNLQTEAGETIEVIVPNFLFQNRRGWFAAVVGLKVPTLLPIIEIGIKRNFFFVVLFGRLFLFGRPLSGGKTFRRAKWQVVG